MGVERRGGVIRYGLGQQPQGRIQQPVHSYDISKGLVCEAWQRVKANKGAAGADGMSIRAFENNLEDELYKLWNRMCSGSYMASAVKRVEIAKSDGKTRPLGIPTVGDRVAQMVVKMTLEAEWDHKFHPSSFGYRPRRSAHQAVEAARSNCWKYGWAIDLDIKGFFDNLSHEHLMAFVARGTQNPWCRLYISRWIKAGVVMPNGEVRKSIKGTPQGGVISPLLANLYLHMVFDGWMQKYFPGNPFERYADDVIIHCRSREEAERLLKAVDQRMQRFDLTLHPEKTRIVRCSRYKKSGGFPESFDFLGFTFRRRTARRRDGKLFPGFSPAISNKAKQAIVKTMSEWNVGRLAMLSIFGLSKKLNPQIRGWFNYYGQFTPSALSGIGKTIDFHLGKWVRWKYPKRCAYHGQATSWLAPLRKERAHLFAHW